MLSTPTALCSGIELGNEINWAAFNPEFPLPGEGKILSLADLSQDPEGKQIAKGFLQYVKIVAVLKQVRDHSRLNRSTPLLSAGMVSAPDDEKLYNNKKEDMVSLPATMTFLRANGLDSLVDGYGIHTYPSTDHPGDPSATSRRAARFESVDLAPCHAAGQPGGKPCWITEWGFPNTDFSCPPKTPHGRFLFKKCALILPRPPPNIGWWAWITLPGIPIPGRNSRTPTASIAAACSRKAESLPSRL
jgi:hypothetical protein